MRWRHSIAMWLRDKAAGLAEWICPEIKDNDDDADDDQSEMEHQLTQEHDFAAHVSHLQRSREWE